MFEHVVNVGSKGRMKIVDRTDESSKVVEFWLQSLSPISIPQLPWTYFLDGSGPGIQSYNFAYTTMWQQVHLSYAPSSVREVTFHLGNTGTTQLDGPVNQTIQTAGYVPPPPPSEDEDPDPPPAEPLPKYALVSVNGVKRLAIPYVKDGVWRRAEPFARSESGWRTT